MAPVLAPCNLSRWLSEVVAQTQAVVVAAIKTHIVTKVVTAAADVASFFSLLLVDTQRGGQRALAVDNVAVPLALPPLSFFRMHPPVAVKPLKLGVEQLNWLLLRDPPNN